MTDNKNRIIKMLSLLLPPLGVAALLLAVFYQKNMYPFGDGSITWCDMSQQVIPLMDNLKDMLTGKSGIFLNLKNAGGMNMWGVIFFFAASPLNLLVLFVSKADMVYFVNILLIVKLMLSAFTAAFYFNKCQKRLSPMFVVILSLSYALCGYGMLFYQNIIWLDEMYLFPLLMTALDALVRKGRVFPYAAALTAVMAVNYYIGYMAVIFILLFMGIYVLSGKSAGKDISVKFFIGSGLSALLSAVVWLPSFAQYLTSGRGEKESQIITSGFFGSYQTTLTQLLCTAFVWAVLAVGICSGRERSNRHNRYLILMLLMLVPMYIEPVNIMWHTGSYMAFPGRYGFITAFVSLICAAMFLSYQNNSPAPLKKGRVAAGFGISFVISAGYCLLLFDFIRKHYTAITNYTSSLWQNETSFLLLAELFVIAFTVFGIFYIFYRKGLLTKGLFSVFVCFVIAAEGVGNVKIYMTSPDYHTPERAKNYRMVMDMGNRINDDDFYRVKSSWKIFDVNLMGAMGYNSLSHYTSLTDRNYMFTAKRLGYSSYWMEVGSSGGTEISDSVMSVKYRIANNYEDGKAEYQNDRYKIVKQAYALPWGIVTKNDLSDCRSDMSSLSREDIQELLYDKLLSDGGDNAVKKYSPASEEGVKVSLDKAPYKFVKEDNEGYIYYSVKTQGRQSLYFDCFDKATVNLREDINDSFDIYVNGVIIQSKYPSQSSNGLVKLGEFENQTVNIKIVVNKDLTCQSFGVFGIDLDKLEKAKENVKTLGLKENSGRITGEYSAEKGEKCMLSLPYQKSLKVKINGEEVKAEQVFGDMISFDLKEGENRIEIVNSPKSFVVGLMLTVLGIIACIAYRLWGGRLKPSEGICRLFNVFAGGLGILVFVLIYIAPCVVKLSN